MFMMASSAYPFAVGTEKANGLAGKKATWGWLEWLLVGAVVALGVQLAWPALERWRNRPRPGVQIAGASETLWYLVYLPAKYDTAICWPLLVYLHGSGQRGSDLELLRDEQGPPGLIERGRDLPMIVVSPQCPADRRWSPTEVLELVDHVVDTLSVDEARIYLTGYSMGGYGTWEVAAAAPGLFAAIAPVAGAGDPAAATRLVDVPVWAFHGAKDDVIPLRHSQEMVDAVRATGGSARLTVYPEQGHAVCGRTYAKGELFDWLLSQRRTRR